MPPGKRSNSTNIFNSKNTTPKTPATKSGSKGLAPEPRPGSVRYVSGYYGDNPQEGVGIMNSGRLISPVHSTKSNMPEDFIDNWNPQTTDFLKAAAGKDPLAKAAAAVARANGSKSSFAGGLPITAAAPQGPQFNPIEAIYDKLIADTKATGDKSLADLDPLRQQMQSEYAQASKQLYEPYQNSRANLDQYAQNLGVTGNDVYKGYDDSLRQIQENSDQSQAMDMAWLDKIKNLKSQSLDSLYMGLSNEKAQQMALWQAQVAQRAQQLAAAARGGGGRGGGGGGGGSSKSNSTGTEVDKMNPSYSQDVMNFLLAHDPQGAAIYASTQNQNSLDPSTKTLQALYDTTAAKPLDIMPYAPPRLPPNKANPASLFVNPKTSSNAASAAAAKNALLKKIQGLLTLQQNAVGGTFNPYVTQSITTKGKG